MRLRDRILGVTQRELARALVWYERLRRGVVYDPYDPRLRSDPFPLYRELRQEDPVHRSWLLGGFVLSRYDDVLTVLSDRRFSADERNSPEFEKALRRMRRHGLLEPEEEIPPSMLRSDPPVHTHLRKLASRAFTPRQIRKLLPRIEAIVDEQLSRRAPEGHMELIADLAYPLPVIVIAELLGVPAEDRERFKHWSDQIVEGLGVQDLASARRSRQASRELQAYFEEIAEQRRADPRDDLLSGMLLAEEDGDRLSTREILGVCQLILIAGHETTTKLIGNGVLELLRHPDQFERLRADPSLAPRAVEEMLRCCGPVQATSRFATEELEIGGERISRGQIAFVLLAAANRDPEHFPDPERFEVGRDGEPHLAFGHGLHFCLGANLARLETEVAVRALVGRFPGLKLAEPAPPWGSNLILRGLERLPLSF